MGSKSCSNRAKEFWLNVRTTLGVIYNCQFPDEEEEVESEIKSRGIKKAFTRLWSSTYRRSGNDFYHNLTNLADESGDEDDEFFNTELRQGGGGIMHRPLMSEKFGSLRFRTKLLDKDLLSLTIVDARDLPPMDANGKADPYVEVGIRPGSLGKVSTIIKPSCRNPVFNETFHLKIPLDAKSDAELVLKVMDSDYPLQDELIGVIRLPLEDLCTRTQKEYSCFILHEQTDSTNDVINVTDAAKLNVKLSSMIDEISDLKKKLNDSGSSLHRLRSENDILRDQCLESVHLSSSDETEEDEKRATSILKSLKFSLEDKDEFISSLQTQVSELKTLLVTASAIWGQLQIGLSYFALGAKLRVDIISARNLKPVNLFGNHSDPYVKLKVHLDRSRRMNSRPSSNVGSAYPRKASFTWEKWDFVTKTCWKTTNPTWNASFIIPEEITTNDLDYICLEFVVKDDARIRRARPIGALILNSENQHWTDMMSNQGSIVKEYHNLNEV